MSTQITTRGAANMWRQAPKEAEDYITVRIEELSILACLEGTLHHFINEASCRDLVTADMVHRWFLLQLSVASLLVFNN